MGFAMASRPRIWMLPEVGASRPVSILMVVDLPAPLGPRKPKNCPGATHRSIPLTATSSPKRRVRPWIEMVGARSIKLLNLAHPPDLQNGYCFSFAGAAFFSDDFFCASSVHGGVTPTNRA